MNASTTPSLLKIPARLKPLAAMASLLERLDRLPRQASPTQYQRLAREVGQMLASTRKDAALEALLQAFPSLSEVYENQHYEQAGLCRAPLAQSLNTELAASSLLKSLRVGPRH